MAGNLVLLVLLRLLDVGGARGVAPGAAARPGGAARALPRLRSLRSLRSGLWSGQPAHEVVEGVGDEDVAPRLIDRQAVGLVQLRASSRLAVAAERAVHAERAVAGERPDRPARRQLADLVVALVGDVDVARAFDRHPGGRDGLCRGCGHPYDTGCGARAPARVASAGDRRDRARRRQLADLVVVGVGDVDVARAVERDPGWFAELGRGRGRPVAAGGRAWARARVAVAGDRRDRPSQRQLADLVVVGVGDVDVARTVDRHPVWFVELG